MAIRLYCPVPVGGKPHGVPVWRAYSQVIDPETHRSTNVATGSVVCGVVVWRKGRPTMTYPKGTHGLVAVDDAVAVKAKAPTPPRVRTARARPTQRARGSHGKGPAASRKGSAGPKTPARDEKGSGSPRGASGDALSAAREAAERDHAKAPRRSKGKR